MYVDLLLEWYRSTTTRWQPFLTQNPPSSLSLEHCKETNAGYVRLGVSSRCIHTQCEDLLGDGHHQPGTYLHPGQLFESKFIILDMHDFDVITGMDWMASRHNLLDYQANTVSISRPGPEPVIVCARRVRQFFSLLRKCRC